jgi:hyperosmotically inducible periplasmic protein
MHRANNRHLMKIPIQTIVLLFAALTLPGLDGVAADPQKPAAKNADADNTAKNERDRNGNNKTPLDQSNKPEDIKITQDIRKAVVADDGLSMTAKNVKIITTADGKVTLRGPVNSDEEKMKIAAHAKKNAGNATVVNQLEVKGKK